MRVAICGGGLIGAAIAWFLSRRGATPVVIERCAVGCAASGKSGGFLALDWCDGTPLQALARRSFALHAALPDMLDGSWGYRRLTTWGGSDGSGAGRRRDAFRPDWLSEDIRLDRRLGTTETTAQVHPGQLAAALMTDAERCGGELRIGEATGLVWAAGRERVRAIRVDADEIDVDAVVLAMGPWSALACEWLPLPAVHGFKGHSLVYDTGSRIGPDALFLEVRDDDGARLSPEIVPRADGTTWVCAVSSDSPLPIDPAAVAPDPGATERLEALAARLSPVLAESRIVARQACFRPVTDDGLPLIGRLPGAEGVHVAAGHSVWGILNAPATGEAMAELILDGRTRSVDLSPFAPDRLTPLDPGPIRARGRGPVPRRL